MGGGGAAPGIYYKKKTFDRSYHFLTLSKILFFDLLSFPLLLSAIKTVSWLWRKFFLIVSGDGGKSAPAKKRNYSKMHSCTAATKGHIFWSTMFFL